jgi:hypothetical protein
VSHFYLESLYFLADALRTAIIAINQLPITGFSLKAHPDWVWDERAAHDGAVGVSCIFSVIIVE